MAFLTNPPPAGIYIHIPFCAQKCLYCDFYSITDLCLQDAFIEGLFREIAATKNQLTFDSLYIGGGTPSLLPHNQIGRIIDRISAQFNLEASAEITLEVNPGTVTLESLKAYRERGVTRLNIGVQSFQNTHLQWLGRMHPADAAKDAILWARAAGFDQIGMDLIYGLPGQSRQAWLADLHQALSFDPEHLSCYMLTCEPDTPLDRMRRHQEFKPMADGDVCDLFETTVMELSGQGYPLYEISNFARKGSNSPDVNRSRHNQKYWTDAPYLGFGPAAHSYLNPVRYRNHRDIAAYLADLYSGTLPIAEKETLSLEQQLMETVFLGLRTLEGISIQRFEEKSGRPFNVLFQDILTDPELKKLITLTPEHCSLTFQGMMVLDSIAGMFVDRI
ncbi:MAG: radical SAM family heme chaperone HemW [Deltaproteobacteria bacterium]|nr:radical SAM family heme chaperone HemW [Deltaproteobacteria bacterium]